MDVLARLSPPLLSHLRVALGGMHHLHVVDEWVMLREQLRHRPVDVVVVEPRDAPVCLEELKSLLARHPSLPVVVYTSLTPDALRVTVELAKVGAPHVVLRGYDDERTQFRAMLERLPSYALSEKLLGQLAPALAGGPEALNRAVQRLFRAPQNFRDVYDLARATGVTRRSLDRWLERIGLRSAKTLVVSARMLRAYHYMRDPGYLLEDIARKLDYPSSRLFARQMRLATGLMPSAVRGEVGPEEFVAQLARRLARPAPRPPASAPPAAAANDAARQARAADAYSRRR